ncbi:MAG TPA: 2-oxoacid:acceptor oxidoreductase subunit alpha, partial [Candidatus Methylomirabilis sp.]|nr:2-oxoacid:acceptor oxidoreductase subunit alpha [Candidatus Methylomirabilis sp.]
MQKEAVLTGRHFMMGNIACAEGALAAGCRFAAGYPITPATEVAERLAERLPGIGGTFLQMEDEIASIAAVIGASWGGLKAMTATSGPGISLMLENIGFALGTETPCVIVNVMRGGPTTGIPSVELQGDVVQPRRGSHGDYQIIALAPSSVQESFDYTVEAFNLAERFRTPVFVLSDAFLGHMREELVIPNAAEVPIVNRKAFPPGAIVETLPGFLDEDVAPMPVFGRGHRAHVTSSCHDTYGRRNVIDATALDVFIKRLNEKIAKHRDEIVRVADDSDGAEVVLVSYGSIFRCAQEAVDSGRAEGMPLGWFKLGTLWPFPDREIAAVAQRALHLIVLENNLGQLFPYVQAAAAGRCPVSFLPPRVLGELHEIEDILKAVREV